MTEAQDQRGVVGIKSGVLAGRMKDLHTDPRELHLRSLTTQSARGHPRPSEHRAQVGKPPTRRVLAVKPKFAGREMLGEEGEPAVVVELRMAHHQDINPANLATPQER